MKITVSLTTIKSREKSVIKTVKSLINQVDKINIFCHGYMPTKNPDIFNNKKINLVYDLEYGDKGDLDKFHWIDEIKEGYHFIVDDDLTFNNNYIKNTIKRIKKLKNENDTIYSYHGSLLKKLPIAHYYKDRYVYSCLNNVEEDSEVSIIGTGVMVYNAKLLHSKLKNFRQEIESLAPNMADIHFSVYALQQHLNLVVLAHKEGEIKHNHIDLSDTIYAKNADNPYLMTKKINENINLFLFQCADNTVEYPLVSIVTVVTRLKNNVEYVKTCFDSIRNQSYPSIQHVLIDNDKKLLTIGKAYNEGVKRSKGDYVLFIGDDDFITTDYVNTLVDLIRQTKFNEKIVGATSYLTMFRQLKTGEIIQEPKRLIPTGMWSREFLIKNPFLEYLNKYVDTELMERAKNMGYYQICATHSYGYFYRSHEQQTSGYKTFSNEEGSAVNQIEINDFINKYR